MRFFDDLGGPGLLILRLSIFSDNLVKWLSLDWVNRVQVPAALISVLGRIVSSLSSQQLLMKAFVLVLNLNELLLSFHRSLVKVNAHSLELRGFLLG